MAKRGERIKCVENEHRSTLDFIAYSPPCAARLPRRRRTFLRIDPFYVAVGGKGGGERRSAVAKKRSSKSTALSQILRPLSNSVLRSSDGNTAGLIGRSTVLSPEVARNKRRYACC